MIICQKHSFSADSNFFLCPVCARERRKVAFCGQYWEAAANRAMIAEMDEREKEEAIRERARRAKANHSV